MHNAENEVTQADREAAAKVRPYSHNSALILDGKRDATDIVQAACYGRLAAVRDMEAEVDRLRQAIKRQASAVRSLQANENTEINILRRGRNEAHAAVSTLDSERQANEILTDELDEIKAQLAEARELLRWYGKQARLCRLIHSEGDAGRAALSEDGGKNARAFLSRTGGEG